jgi:hypothetical protein
MVRRRVFALFSQNTSPDAPSPDDASHRSENHEGPAVASILRDASRAATLLRMRRTNNSKDSLKVAPVEAGRLMAQPV